jgi:hypothetical protein
VGGPGRCTHDDEIVGVFDLGHPVAQYPPKVIWWGHLVVAVFRECLHEVAAWHTHLDGANVFQVTGHRGLSRLDTYPLEQLDKLPL